MSERSKWRICEVGMDRHGYCLRPPAPISDTDETHGTPSRDQTGRGLPPSSPRPVVIDPRWPDITVLLRGGTLMPSRDKLVRLAVEVTYHRQADAPHDCDEIEWCAIHLLCDDGEHTGSTVIYDDLATGAAVTIQEAAIAWLSGEA